MKGLLVRVAIDATAGNWNGPVNTNSGKFVYVSIPEEQLIQKGLEYPYDPLSVPLANLHVNLPLHLRGHLMHLDPDFSELTYGDCPPRSLPIKNMERVDFLVFYASLRPIDAFQPNLYYAIIGFYLIDEIIAADSIPENHRHENAHARRKICQGDTVVRAQRGQSGRLKRCVEIGEYRDRAYRVKKDLLTQWGGLSVKDGYIHRSARLPSFTNPVMFLRWFRSQHPVLIEQNNE